ncbi:hypothetical protein DIQ79_16120 [Mycolicibacterium smegmatis]|uniref:Uncharacterized protein n=1 Tax=Mycolicibacterium smegmatis (strain ATCC 700084 / mc(2)155) TaxID=246196 RepID=A0R2U0_MYCS2|nr:hypothetical protein MSMEG_5232 [Mycolicibacterium smegmatis MC2 155]TBM50357.1 hypothetical protein DIQ85_15705 [Mycolicibacterium smegmatis]TBH45019.1 hypothetical protein EYS45_13870 [Mycolicibacterium smegmatis MC2 155]TBM50795.1 hypothetical protein DIQ86_06580 [Mycolicibacterium smegmatis]TBM61444.1 hypothetical protein DIQ83_15765 [Mycolicibacterium smegmatis]
MVCVTVSPAVMCAVSANGSPSRRQQRLVCRCSGVKAASRIFVELPRWH